MFDHLETRCPRLGHMVKFSYCRKEGGTLPCSRVIQCWQGFFSVVEYLEKIMGREKMENVFSMKPKEKVVSILEIVEKVRREKRNDGKAQ